MGIIVNKNQNDKSAIQARINADLRERMSKTSDDGLNTDIEKAEYLKETQKTSHFGWIWLVLIVGAIISIILMLMI